MTRAILCFSLLLLFASCEKEEIPVMAPPPGDLTLKQVEMGGDYRDQLFYSLKDNEVISQNIKNIWDLHFESGEEGWHIKLNSAKFMGVSFFEGYSMEDEISIADAEWKWDNNNGNLDSTAIGDWQNKIGVYLIDRGYNHQSAHTGYRKLKINAVDANSYDITISNLDGSSMENLVVVKDPSLSYVPFSFSTTEHFPVVDPHKDTWDMVFTQYTYIYYDLEPITPYLVVGVLLNPNNVSAIMTKEHNFEDIDLELATSMTMSKDIDEIGHEWKFFNFDEGHYTIEYDQIFIIKSVDGVYYKLRFVDFYNEDAIKGSPMFEFQKL